MPYMRSNYKVAGPEILASVIEASHIKAATIGATHLGSWAVQASAIGQSVIQGCHLAAASFGPTHLMSWAVPRSALAQSIIQACHMAPGELQTHLVRFRETAQLDSGSTVFTFSTGGYGRPLWVRLTPLSIHDTMINVLGVSVSATGSIFNVSLGFSATSWSVAATVSYVFDVLCLIASR
jgi:hypothetical protein